MKTTTLRSRYGVEWPVLDYEDGAFEVDFTEALCMRFSSEEGGTDISFIDPDGGPFIAVGGEFMGREVTSIVPTSKNSGIYRIETK